MLGRNWMFDSINEIFEFDTTPAPAPQRTVLRRDANGRYNLRPINILEPPPGTLRAAAAAPRRRRAAATTTRRSAAMNDPPPEAGRRRATTKLSLKFVRTALGFEPNKRSSTILRAHAEMLGLVAGQPTPTTEQQVNTILRSLQTTKPEAIATKVASVGAPQPAAPQAGPAAAPTDDAHSNDAAFIIQVVWKYTRVNQKGVRSEYTRTERLPKDGGHFTGSREDIIGHEVEWLENNARTLFSDGQISGTLISLWGANAQPPPTSPPGAYLTGFHATAVDVIAEQSTIDPMSVKMLSGTPPRDETMHTLPYTMETAFKDTDGLCAPVQLAEFLLHPTSSRCAPVPILINAPPREPGSRRTPALRTSVEGILEYFRLRFPNSEPELGVTPNMVAELCRHRGMPCYIIYNNRVIYHHEGSESGQRLQPVVFTVSHNHMYLCDNSAVVKTLRKPEDAEEAEEEEEKIVNPIFVAFRDEDKETIIEKKAKLDVFFRNADLIEPIETWLPGVYFIRPSVDDESKIEHSVHEMFLSCITHSSCYPKNIKSAFATSAYVTSFTVTDSSNNPIIVNLDTPFDSGSSHPVNRALAQRLGIPFYNEDIGSIARTALDCFYNKRSAITDEIRASVHDAYSSKCAICSAALGSEEGEIDHIIALSNGGLDGESNLQLLCVVCHREKTSHEIEAGYRKTGEWVSHFSERMIEVVSSDHFKAHARVEKYYEGDEVPQPPSGFNTVSYDVNKCRRQLLIDLGQPWLVYTPMDAPRPFTAEDNVADDSNYYVVTSDTTVLRGCGVYGSKLVRLALDERVITRDNIRDVYRASRTLKPTFFSRFVTHAVNAHSTLIDDIAEMPGYDANELSTYKTQIRLSSKLLPNALVGTFARSEHVSSSIRVFSSREEAIDICQTVTKECIGRKSYVVKMQGCDLYAVNTTTSMPVSQSTYSLYKQIIEVEAFQMLSFAIAARIHSAIPLAIKTDFIAFHVPVEEADELNKIVYNIDYGREKLWDERMTRMFKPEAFKGVRNECMKNYRREDTLRLKPLCGEVREYHGDDYASVARDEVERRTGGIIDGCAGVGKTRFVTEMCAAIDALARDRILLTTTHASRLAYDASLKCQTVAKLQRLYRRKAVNVFEKCANAYIIVDESSMLNESDLTMFTMIKRACPSCVIFFVGDLAPSPSDPTKYAQFGPVADRFYDAGGSYVDLMLELCCGWRLTLTKNHRIAEGEAAYYDEVMRIRNTGVVDVSAYPVRVPTYINIAYTNSTRAAVNNACTMSWLAEAGVAVDACAHAEAYAPSELSQSLLLARGMPLFGSRSSGASNIFKSVLYELVDFVSFDFDEMVEICAFKRLPDLYEVVEAGAAKFTIGSNFAATPFSSLDESSRNLISQSLRASARDAFLHKRPFVAVLLRYSTDGNPIPTWGKPTNVSERLVDAVPNAALPLESLSKFAFPGFCMTMHGSQSRTFREPYTIYELEHEHCGASGLYVAMSRGTVGRNVQIARSSPSFVELPVPSVAKKQWKPLPSSDRVEIPADATYGQLFMAEYIMLFKFFRANDSNCLPMFAKKDDKSPVYRHADGSYDAKCAGVVEKVSALLSDFDRTSKVVDRESYNLNLLLDDLFVIDLDTPAAVDFFEREIRARFPADFEACPVQKTRKGYHYVFVRPDSTPMVNGARCLTHDDVKLEIDVCTVASTGTRGNLNVAPSANKEWVRHPFDFPPRQMSDGLQAWLEAHYNVRATSKKKNKRPTAASSSSHAEEGPEGFTELIAKRAHVDASHIEWTSETQARINTNGGRRVCLADPKHVADGDNAVLTVVGARRVRYTCFSGCCRKSCTIDLDDSTVDERFVDDFSSAVCIIDED